MAATVCTWRAVSPDVACDPVVGLASGVALEAAVAVGAGVGGVGVVGVAAGVCVGASVGVGVGVGGVVGATSVVSAGSCVWSTSPVASLVTGCVDDAPSPLIVWGCAPLKTTKALSRPSIRSLAV